MGALAVETDISRPPGRRAALVGLTFACATWGISFVLLKDLDTALASLLGGSAGLAAGWTVTARFLLAACLVLPLPAVRRGLSRPVWRDAFFLALPSVAGYFLQAAGMRGLTAGTNAFLTSLYTPLTPLLAWRLLRRRPATRILLVVPVALLGVFLITGPSGMGFGVYEFLVCAGAGCWALQILLIDRYGLRHPPGAFCGAAFLWTGGLSLSLLTGIGFDRFPAMARALIAPEVQVPLWGLVLLSTILTSYLLVRFQPRLDPSRAALLYVAEPAFAAVFAMTLHGEAFAGWKLAGCLVLLGANVLVEIRRAPAAAGT